MGIFKNKVGMVFGRLTVLSFEGYNKNRHSTWRCLCTCVNETVVVSPNLVSGTVASCGCGEIESRHIASRTHGHTAGDSDTPEYVSWCSMMTRCYNENRDEWHRYGGRGIKVCDRWQSFENFLTDMGTKPSPKHSIDRIDNDGNYEPENCKWSTMREQTQNTSRNVNLTLNGETLCISEWARRLGIGESVIRLRLGRGWSVEKTLTTQLLHKRSMANLF